jgi:DNA polymerase III alpha subunit (gram-positive type)
MNTIKHPVIGYSRFINDFANVVKLKKLICPECGGSGITEDGEADTDLDLDIEECKQCQGSGYLDRDGTPAVDTRRKGGR